MENIFAKSFLTKSNAKAVDLEHRKKINFNIGKYNAVVPKGKEQFTDLERVREMAKNRKWEAVEHLDTYLLQFEEQLIKRGGQVLWAEDAEQALNFIGEICAEKKCRSIVKSKSMVTEEIHLNNYLESIGIESVETDLGEYIQQMDGEAPYHIVTPAMHKSKEDVAKLFNEKLGTDINLTPEELTLVARKNLRDKYVQAEIGVTGANFIIPDIGGIALTENEGNARLSASWPIISGPRQADETDGPEEMIVILLDNGRTDLLANAKSREALYCIRCGACLNACPVYKNIGGHSYDTTYSGPIGSVITPHLRGMHDYKHLSDASSLCGNCTEVCPVRINLHDLLLDNRKQSVEGGESSFTENFAWKIWKQTSMSRNLMNQGTAPIKNWVINKMFKGWSNQRAPLEFPNKTFNQLYKEGRKN